MSLSLTIFSLEPSQAEAYEAAFLRVMGQAATRQIIVVPDSDPEDWTDVSGEPEHLLPEDLLEKAEPTLTLTWEAFGLSYLLERASSAAGKAAWEPGTLIEQVFGKELGSGLNPDDSIHNRVLLTSAETAEAAAFLGRFEPEALRAFFDSTAMLQAQVQPKEGWQEAGRLESLLAAFEQLKAFYEAAHFAGRSLVTELLV